jgi:hypothetical protein
VRLGSQLKAHNSHSTLWEAAGDGKHDHRPTDLPTRFRELFWKMLDKTIKTIEVLKHHTVYRVIGICDRYGDRGAHQTTEVPYYLT